MKTLLHLEVFYVIIGLVFAYVAARVALDAAHPRRWGTTLFWALLAVTYALAQQLPSAAIGYIVLVLVLLASTGQVKRSTEQTTSESERVALSARLGDRLFAPALLVPGIVIVVSVGVAVASYCCGFSVAQLRWSGWQLVDPKQFTLITLGSAALIATAVALRVTREQPTVAVEEGGRLLQSIGWALILPQMLAALGGIFSVAKVGDVVARLVQQGVPIQFPFVAVAAYCIGMAVFTMCMGNAFAAFAAITGGIGLPFVVQMHHGNPAIMAAVGMLSGYCGTLMTPMAANFNIVPAMLLELRDKNAVIKAQIPIGLTLLAANVLIMYLCVYRF